MKLSEEQKNELRKMLEDELKNVPKGMRKKLPKDVLEELIFRSGVKFNGDLKLNYIGYIDELQLKSEVDSKLDTLNDTLGKCKFPVWTGDFLSKLDLSELSFDSVVWCLDDIYT